jgi:hypothetical protein
MEYVPLCLAMEYIPLLLDNMSIYHILAMKYIQKFGNRVCTTIFRWSMYHILMKYVRNLPMDYIVYILCLHAYTTSFAMEYIPFLHDVYTIFSFWWTMFHILAVEYGPHLAMESMPSGIYHTIYNKVYTRYKGICCPKTRSIHSL